MHDFFVESTTCKQFSYYGHVDLNVTDNMGPKFGHSKSVK